jgi:hypothetical protein
METIFPPECWQISPRHFETKDGDTSLPNVGINFPRLHGITFHKTTILTFTVVKTRIFISLSS